MNGIVHRQTEAEGAEHRDRHVVILADQPDDAIDQPDGDAERNHRQQPPGHGTEQPRHHQQHDDEAACQRLHHAADHAFLPDDIDVIQPVPAQLDSHGGRIFGGIVLDCGNDLAHILVVAAFELHPDIRFAVIGGHEMPQIVGTMAVLIGQQGLRHGGGAVGNAEFLRLAQQQFTMHRLDDVAQRIGLADMARIQQCLLQPLDIAQHLGLFEDLLALQFGADEILRRIPGIVFLIRGGIDLFLDKGVQDLQQGRLVPGLCCRCLGPGGKSGKYLAGILDTLAGGAFLRLFQACGEILQIGIQPLAVISRHQRQIGHIGAAEMPVQYLVGDPDGVGFLEPFDRIVVDIDPADAITAQHHQRRDPQHDQTGMAVHGPAQALQPPAHHRVRIVRIGGKMAEVLQLFLRHHHDIGGHEQDCQDPGEENADGNENAEHLHRRNRGQRQRGETDHRRQRGKQHRHEQLMHDLAHGLPAIPGFLIPVEEFRKDVHRIEHRDRHDENRNHRAHDMNGVAADHQQRHGRDRRHHGHDHRRNDQGQIPEEQPHDQEDHHHRQGGGDRHLDEHFDAEGILGNRQTGDVDPIAGVLPGGRFLQQCLAHAIGHVLRGQRQINGEHLAVAADQRVIEHRNFHRPFAHGQGLFARFGRFGHQPAEADGTEAGLADIVDHRRGENIRFHHPDLLFRILRIRPFQTAGEFRQFIDALQRIGVENPVGIGFIGDTDDNDVVQGKFLLHRIVEHAHRFVMGQHVLRVRIDGERIQHREPFRPQGRQYRQHHQQRRHQPHGPGNEPRPRPGKFDHPCPETDFHAFTLSFPRGNPDHFTVSVWC